jgi:hypothetical protein
MMQDEFDGEAWDHLGFSVRKSTKKAFMELRARNGNKTWDEFLTDIMFYGVDGANERNGVKLSLLSLLSGEYKLSKEDEFREGEHGIKKPIVSQSGEQHPGPAPD